MHAHNHSPNCYPSPDPVPVPVTTSHGPSITPRAQVTNVTSDCEELHRLHKYGHLARPERQGMM